MRYVPYIVVVLSLVGTFTQWLGEMALRLRAHAPRPASPVPHINVSFRGVA